jgi:ABC-type multidrug transport system ATPase subunit
VICTEGLAKRYGDTLALDDLDLTLEVGEVLRLPGAERLGKTTTIRLQLSSASSRSFLAGACKVGGHR